MTLDWLLVQVAGFEPTISGTQIQCRTKLGYTQKYKETTTLVERMGFEPTLNGFLVSNAGADPAHSTDYQTSPLPLPLGYLSIYYQVYSTN